MKNSSSNVGFRRPRFPRRSRADFCVALVFGKLTLGKLTPGTLTLGMLMLLAPQLHSQTPNPPAPKPGSKPSTSSSASNSASKSASKIAAIKSFRIVQEKDGQAVEILSTKPLVPSIQAITDPDRLVIDLPNARLDTPQKRVSVQADQISSLRADQYQPNVARVVVDLLAPRAYTWDAAGNRLVVHLGKSPSPAQSKTSPFEPPAAPTVPTLTPVPLPAVSVVRAPGPLALAGDNGSSVSSVTAGPDTAVLRLSSGGEVRVCPGTTVSVTPSQNRHNVMFSMNTGALEAHFGLDASSDTVMTPDFRILLAGPGQFHYAISADSHGNTCVRALPGNTASAIVSELLGDRTYQVKPTDQLVFRSGQLDRVDMAVPPDCGCPPPRDPPLRATSALPTQSESQNTDSQNSESQKNAPNQLHDGAVIATPSPEPPHTPPPAPPRTESASSTAVPAAAPLDASAAPNELHVQIEAPFVFHATGPPPAPVEAVRALPVDSRPRPAPPSVAPLPPPVPSTDTASTNHTPPRGFFRKLGGFFASLFH